VDHSLKLINELVLGALYVHELKVDATTLEWQSPQVRP